MPRELARPATDKAVVTPETGQFTRDSGGGGAESRMLDTVRKSRFIAGQAAFANFLAEASKLIRKQLPKAVRESTKRQAYYGGKLTQVRQFKAVSHNKMGLIKRGQRSQDAEAFVLAQSSGEEPQLARSEVLKIQADLALAERSQEALEHLIVKEAGVLMDAYTNSTWHKTHLVKYWAALIAEDMDGPGVTNAEKESHASRVKEAVRIFTFIATRAEEWSNAGFTDAERKALTKQILELPDEFPTLLDVRSKTYSQQGLTLHPGAEGVAAAAAEKAAAERTEQEVIAADAAKARNLTPAAIKAAKERASKLMASTSIAGLEGSLEDK